MRVIPFASVACATHTTLTTSLTASTTLTTFITLVSFMTTARFCTTDDSYMKTHLLVHAQVARDLTCEQRGYRTDRKSNLTRHMLSHTGDESFDRNRCDYRASVRSITTRHKPHVCTICDYRASQKQHLVMHMRSHTENPIESEHCA